MPPSRSPLARPGAVPRSGWLMVAACALAGAAALLYATSRYGIGATNDSADYLAAAHSFARGEGWRSISGAPFALWPPAYPTLLGLPALLGIDPRAGARYLNAVLYAGTLLLAGRWLVTHLRSRAVAGLGLLALLSCYLLLRIAVLAWSEMTFVFLVVAALVAAERYQDTGRAPPLVAFAALAGVASVTRYAGAPLIPLGLLLVWARRGTPWSVRLGHGAAFAALALLPAVLWFARNLWLGGTVFGTRTPGSGDPLAVAADSWPMVRTLLLPDVAPTAAFGLALAAVVTVAALVFLAVWRTRGRCEPAAWVRLVPLGGFVVLYWGFIVTAKTAIGEMEPRYMVPVAVPLILIVFFALDRALAAGAGLRLARAHRAGLLAALLVWLLAYPVPLTGLSLARMHARGVPKFAEDVWQLQELVRALRSRPLPEGDYHSNAPGLFYWLTGHTVQGTPALEAGPGEGGAAFARRVAQRGAAGETVYVVWFARWNWGGPASPADLARHVTLTPVWRAADGSGTIFRATPAAP